MARYNGSERWTVPGAVAELPAPWWPARLELAPFQRWGYVLLSLRLLAVAGGSLDLHTWTGALLADMSGAESALPSLVELEGLRGGKEMAIRAIRWNVRVRLDKGARQRRRPAGVSVHHAYGRRRR